MYLLDLDWPLAVELEHVRSEEQGLKAARRQAQAHSQQGEIRAVLAQEEQRVSALSAAIDELRLVPAYEQLERELAVITEQLGRLADANVIDRRRLMQLGEALEAERAPSTDDVEALYNLAGVQLPSLVKSRFDEVLAFHQRVIENRRLYLQGELNEAQVRIRGRGTEMADLVRRRSEVPALIGSRGAVDQLLALQRELSDGEARVASLELELGGVQAIDARRAELDVKRAEIHLRLQRSFHEQQSLLKRISLVFAGVATHLYESGGSLELEPTPSGPQFNIRMQGDLSVGVRRMEIFCFDMMLMHVATVAGRTPGFLVHDSHLFDGVDERQVSRALEYGAQASSELGFQYIVTLNDDSLPDGYLAGGGLRDAILDVSLTDATADGGLFGFRFD